MSQDTTYQGWTNYATWRVNLELADDIIQSLSDEDNLTEPYADAYTMSKDLQDQCEEIVTNYGSIEGLAADYALAFMSDVNWLEIAEHAAQDYPHLIAREEEED
jgi:hypothetical protein